jgi:hypothetical protein
MNPKRERGFLCWLVANMLAAGAAARAQAPALKVEAIPIPETEDTGTYHGLAELRLSSGHGTPLVLRDRNDGEQIPFPGPQFSMGREHVLLLGWSSVGSGTNTLHALLLHLTPEAVVLEHNLKVTLARRQAVLVVRRVAPDALLLGIPEWWKVGGGIETSLVVGKGWGESTREQRARALRFVATETRSTDAHYDPPFFLAARLAPLGRAAGGPLSSVPELPERVAWLRVTRDGLAWKAGVR